VVTMAPPPHPVMVARQKRWMGSARVRKRQLSSCTTRRQNIRMCCSGDQRMRCCHHACMCAKNSVLLSDSWHFPVQSRLECAREGETRVRNVQAPLGLNVTLHLLDVVTRCAEHSGARDAQAIIKMLRVTIAMAMILAIVLLVVKTSVVRLPALPGLRKLMHELLAAIPNYTRRADHHARRMIAAAG
jgi:hypothetical protein